MEVQVGQNRVGITWGSMFWFLVLTAIGTVIGGILYSWLQSWLKVNFPTQAAALGLG